MKQRYLFFVYSNFHYIICKNIIIKYNYKIDDCFFIVERDVKLDKGMNRLPSWYSLFVLSDNPIRKLLAYVKHKKEILSIFNGGIVSFYSPFSFKYPTKDMVSAKFIEEGFSSYMANANSLKDKTSLMARLRIHIKKQLGKLISLVGNANIRLFVVGLFFQEDKPHFETTIYSLSKNSYLFIDSPLVKKIVLNNVVKPDKLLNIPRGGIMLVLDRLSPGGRPYSLENYDKCLEEEIKWIIDNNTSNCFVKFHPVDADNERTKNHFFSVAKQFHVNFTEFKGNLEYLAMMDLGLSYVGTNSTILFYAPLLGLSNRSFSFSRCLEEVDKDYKRFMESFGGIEGFVSVFSHNVQCL